MNKICNIKFLALVFFLLFSQVSKSELIERTVAIVNSEIILESDISQYMAKNSRTEMIDEVLLTNGAPDDLKNSRKMVLDYLVNLKLIEYEVKKQNLSATDDRVDMALKDLAKNNNTTISEIETFYQSQGMNKSDLRRFIKAKVERQALIDSEINSKLRISDEEILMEYQKKFPNRKQQVGEITVSHILFNVKKAGGVKGALSRAETVLSRLKKGEKFDLLAEQFSEDPNFSNYGLLGSFKAGEASREIETAIQPLKVGQTSQVVQTKNGVHIFKLLDRKLVQDPQFEKDKVEITFKLRGEAFQKLMKKWLKSKREEAFIRLNE